MFKWPEEITRRVKFSRTHFTDETLHSIYGRYEVLKVISTRAVFENRIYPCQFALVLCGDGLGYECFIGERRQVRSRNTWYLDNVKRLINDCLLNGLNADGPEKRGGVGKILPKDCVCIAKFLNKWEQK